LESPWNSTYFNNYLENLANQLTREFEEWKTHSSEHDEKEVVSGGSTSSNSTTSPGKRLSVGAIDLPRSASGTSTSGVSTSLALERRRSLNPDEATLSSQPLSAPEGQRRKSLFDQMAQMVSPRSGKTGSRKNSSIPEDEGKEKEQQG